MQIRVFTILFLLFTGIFMQAQKMNEMSSDIPYYDIPDAPENFTAGNLVGRMIDGLGYRYFWATEGLTDEDIEYRVSEDSRTLRETLDHIYGLSKVCLNAGSNSPNVRPAPEEDLTWVELREKTLEVIAEASQHFKNISGDDIQNSKMIFKRGENQSEFPIWNLLNGPLADAIYHTGQIVALRRAAGNPVSPLMNVFSGKTRREE